MQNDNNEHKEKTPAKGFVTLCKDCINRCYNGLKHLDARYQRWVILFVGAIIFFAYLFLNLELYPSYPVIRPFAEEISEYKRHYPPFRETEWDVYALTRSFIDAGEDSISVSIPAGVSILSIPLTKAWGPAGPYFTNALIMWASAMAFFFFVRRIMGFALALLAVFVLAFASPNFFFAAGAYPESLAQLCALVSLLFFFKAQDENEPNKLYFMSGVMCALILTAQPVLAAMIIVLAMVYFGVISKLRFRDRSLQMLVSGFIVTSVFLMAISRFLMGSFTALFGGIDFLVNQSIARGDNSTANVILGMWRLIFDSPHGLLFIMPLLILVPSGILYMWRCERRRVVLTTGLTAALVIVITSLSPIPVTGETVGSRSLLPIIPLLIIPAVFIEQRGSGEKVIFGFLLLLTIYMSSFGWLYGVARGRGFFAGVLQDSHARAVLLARKDDLSMPEFRSAGELREAFFSALKRHDLRLWLTLLSDRSTEEIREIERTIFNMQIRLFENRGAKHDLFFLHTDPDSGITITIPDPTESMDDTVPDSDN